MGAAAHAPLKRPDAGPRWACALAAMLAAVTLAGCGHTGRHGPEPRRLEDALKACSKTYQRVQLIDPNAPASQQGGSYTNIQDSRGKRQTGISNPVGSGPDWYRCIS